MNCIAVLLKNGVGGQRKDPCGGHLGRSRGEYVAGDFAPEGPGHESRAKLGTNGAVPIMPRRVAIPGSMGDASVRRGSNAGMASLYLIRSN